MDIPNFNTPLWANHSIATSVMQLSTCNVTSGNVLGT